MRHLSLLLACMLTYAPLTRAEEAPAEQAAAAPTATEQATTAAVQPEKKQPPRRSGVRSKDMDLRHCLELQDNAAIAKCAGE